MYCIYYVLFSVCCLFIFVRPMIKTTMHHSESGHVDTYSINYEVSTLH